MHHIDISKKGPRGVVAFLLVVMFLSAGPFAFLAARAEQQSETSGFVREYFTYNCMYTDANRYEEEQIGHYVEIEFMNLKEGVHEITTTLSTQENLQYLIPLSSTIDTPNSTSQNGKTVITANTDQTYFSIRVGLNNTKTLFDPIDVALLPLGQNVHPLDKLGYLNFDFSLNSSEFLDSCNFRCYSYGDVQIHNLKLTKNDLKCTPEDNLFDMNNLLLSNVSAGNGHITLEATANQLSGDVNIEITASQKRLDIIGVECYVDNKKMSTTNSRQAKYSINGYEFVLQENPLSYYKDSRLYCVNFTAPAEFTLRIDPNSREIIDFLTLSVLPSNFSISEEDFQDETFYVFTFDVGHASNCSLGLDLSSKGWFIDPESMSINDIPSNIKTKYLSSSASFDGEYFCLDDKFVQQWAREVSGNETNPFVIANSIFKNITNTLTYTSNWQEHEDEKFNESVVDILTARSGVCRHYARAYAALCICSGLPARTVLGTAFGSFDEFWKKNHEWVEIYLPRYGWVTMDPTWNETFLLSNEHTAVTSWSYLENSTSANYTDQNSREQSKAKSSELILNIIHSFEQSINKSTNSQVEILIDQAKELALKGNIHDALLNIAKAYNLVNENAESDDYGSQTLSVVIFFALGIALGTIGFYLLYRRRLNSSNSAIEKKAICAIEGRSIIKDFPKLPSIWERK